MRFNKAELATLASNPNTRFDKEGLLIITERQEGFFRRTDVNCPRWCKLRGNLLFYLKDHDPRSQPTGLIVLENCRPVIKIEEREFDGFSFILEFEGSFPQRLCTRTPADRLEWVKAIQLSSCNYMNRQIQYLQQQIQRAMGNRIEAGTPFIAPSNEADLLNFSTIGATTAATMYGITSGATTTSQQAKEEEDLSEIPICESALSCDNLPTDDNGRLPNPRIVCAILCPGEDALWQDYARTEIVENSTSPQFICTICFRQSFGFTPNTLLRFTVYDVREKVSSTAVPLGFAEVALGVIQDATHFRIPIKSINGECGSITISSWAPETEKQAPPRSTTQVFEPQRKGHRRSQSLPPKLGVKLFVPYQGQIQRLFANPKIHTYRLHSSMGGDISVHETLMESKLCYTIPHQLLSIWISREKELLQEISGMGELGGEWRQRQMDLLDKHLKLLKDYSQAKQVLQHLIKEEGDFFKKSSVKTDESLEFIPVNLHLQRMWAQNDTLNRTGVLDIITVGAFTRHATKKTGGLIKLLQETKESPNRSEVGHFCKVNAANDAVQAIKQLRKEIVEIMSQLLTLAKMKNPKGMMPLSNELIKKTKALLNLWEPTLVEEAFAFIEKHRIIEEPDNIQMPISPFRKITQQLTALNLKSPELEDFATPVVAPPDLWPCAKTPTNPFNGRPLMRSNSLNMRPSSSILDINAIHSLQNAVRSYNEQLKNRTSHLCSDEEAPFQSLPVHLNSDLQNGNEFQSVENSTLKLIDLDEIAAHQMNLNQKQSATNESRLSIMSNSSTYGWTDDDEANDNNTIWYNGGFLDTKIMSSSPSANYYSPTEEPEPLDLTQLNIEASVMCLVSKIKFLCGRCGSPAIRLRHPKTNIKRSGFVTGPGAPPDVVQDSPEIKMNKKPENSTENAANTSSLNGNNLILDLTQTTAENKKRGNKFTDGLDLSMTTDWASELRPSMRKLRHAMDGLLKTARLMHSVQRLQQDMKRISVELDVMYRRDVCFSQALTALASGLMAKFWGTEIQDNYVRLITELGPLAYFEGLLSLHGNEVDMWSDMSVAIEDLLAVNFVLIRHNSSNDSNHIPMPRLTGSRHSLNVLLPVPEHLFAIIPNKSSVNFKVTPVFFNIGINEKATIAETLGQTREQHRSNCDNFMRLKQYYSRFRKLNLHQPDTPNKCDPHFHPAPQVLQNIFEFMETQLQNNLAKNVKILHLAEDACRLMSGLRFTSCKSAKDRTGMSTTLEQCRVLVQEFQLPAKNVPFVLNTMRSEGTRMDNVLKNINKRKYAFNLPQVLSLPAMYRPPIGAYGKAET